MAAGAFLANPGWLHAQQQVLLNQISSPAGLFSLNHYVTSASWTNSTNAPTSIYGYSFVGWSVNGSDVRTNVATVLRGGVPGEALNPIPLKLTSATTIVANYVPTAQDSEGMGVPDWWKLYYFGTTNLSSTNIMTGDGLSLLEKYVRGYDPTQFAVIDDGGISRRDSGLITVLLNLNMVYLSTLSDPLCLFSSVIPVSKGAVQTISAPRSVNGYQFIGWFDSAHNRLDTPDGNGTTTIKVGSGNAAVKASYLPETQVSSIPGVPDWWQSYYLSNLTNTSTSQPSGDGFTIVQDYQRGYDPRMIHQIVDGGISRRASSLISVALVPARTYSLLSDPPGILNIQTNSVDSKPVTSPNLLGNQSAGYQFAYWNVGGRIRTNLDGSAMGEISFTPTNGFIATATYVPAAQDTFSNGIPDWWEYNYFGALTNVVTNSASGDGFSLLQDYQRGYNPLMIHQLVDGGISRRDSALILLDLQPQKRDAQTLTPFVGVTNRSYGTNPFTIILPTASSGLGVTVSAAPKNVVSISGNIVTMKGIGSATLTAVQAGNSNYFGVTNSTNFVISKAAQTLTAFVGVTNRFYSPTPFAITPPKASSGLAVAVSAVPTNLVSVSKNMLTMKGVGTATLKAVQAGNGNYFGVTNSINFVISKAPQTLTAFGGVTNRIYSSKPYVITLPKASSGLGVSVSALPTSVVSLSGNKVTMKGAGTATLTAVQAGNANYQGVTNSVSFVISPKK